MLRAVIFDCDGVIADTEPLHLAAFQKVLGEEGIELTEEDYYRRYLALDDRGCFTRAFLDNGKSLTIEALAELISRKASYIEPVMRGRLTLFPGAADFIRRVSAKYPAAVASGALRREVELILEHGGLSDCFQLIVSAEDVAESKPAPDPFLKALALLNEAAPQKIYPRECLVVEDSVHGVEAAHSAGMFCLAVTNSYPKERLARADRVVESLEKLSLSELEDLLNDQAQQQRLLD